MSEPIDTRVRELVKASSIETREAIFEDLLRELMQVDPDQPSLPLVAESGEILGFYLRPAPIVTPDMTPEEDAELQRRLATIDDVIDKEELIRRLMERVPTGSPSR